MKPIRRYGIAALISGYAAADMAGQCSLVHSLVSSNEQTNGVFGSAVAGAGDVNGDGYNDIVSGAPGENSGEGKVYVYSGSNGVLQLSLQSPSPVTNGSFGNSVSGAGDVNGDGKVDLLIGAPMENSGDGKVYIFSGSGGGLLVTFLSPNPDFGGFGVSVSKAGDVNADGYEDFLIGAWTEDPGPSPDDAGRAYIFSGNGWALLYTLQRPVESMWAYFGRAVSEAGDVNGDGFDDVMVGAHLTDSVYVFSGNGGGLLYKLFSPNGGGDFGFSLDGAGDVNLDGYDDMIIGAYSETDGAYSWAGRAYVFSGVNGSLLYTFSSPNVKDFSFFGVAVAGIGDYDNDGTPDLAVGSQYDDAGSAPILSGRAYVFSGATGSLICTLVSPNEEVTGIFCNVSSAGDVNNDGFRDVIVGAPWENPGTSPDAAGKAYVFSYAAPLGFSEFDFRAEKISGFSVLLGWTAQNKTLTQSAFTLERSSDGTKWYRINRVPEMTQDESMNRFLLSDTVKLAGTYYYRLQKYSDGMSSLTSTIEVNFYSLLPGNISLVSIYPNPVPRNGILKMDFLMEKEGRINIMLSNSSGKRFLAYESFHSEGKNTLSIDLKGYSPGIYYYSVQLTTGSGQDLSLAGSFVVK